MSKKAETEAVASKARADKLLQQAQARSKALLDQSTKTQAISQTAPAPRRHMAKPQPAAESPPPRPVMRDEVMSFPESEEREFIVGGGTLMAATVSLLLAAAGAGAPPRDEDDEGEAE